MTKDTPEYHLWQLEMALSNLPKEIAEMRKLPRPAQDRRCLGLLKTFKEVSESQEVHPSVRRKARLMELVWLELYSSCTGGN